MGNHYAALRYLGNVTGSDAAQPGTLLSFDELGRQYEVVDAEYIPDEDVTHVFLQYATAETLRTHAQRSEGGRDDRIEGQP